MQPKIVTAEEITLDSLMDDATIAIQRASAAGRDTRALSQEERVSALAAISRALGLNPLVNGVQFLSLNGREVLYVTKHATDQIAARQRLNRETIAGPEVRDVAGAKLVFCQVRVTAPDGRSEVATATLPLKDVTNDLMKCETKAKRRATLSLAGLGLLAEDEMDTMPGAQRVDVHPAIASVEGFAQLGIEARTVTAPREPSDALVVDLATQAARCKSVAGLASLWVAAKADVAALNDRSLQERAWATIKVRARDLGIPIEALRAEIARQMQPPPPPPTGTDGPSGPSSASESDDAPAPAPAPVAAPAAPMAGVARVSDADPDAWRLTREGIDAHVAAIRVYPRLGNSARKHLRHMRDELTLHAIHAYARRMTEIQPSIEWEHAIERVETWMREGPIATRTQRAA